MDLFVINGIHVFWFIPYITAMIIILFKNSCAKIYFVHIVWKNSYIINKTKSA